MVGWVEGCGGGVNAYPALPAAASPPTTPSERAAGSCVPSGPLPNTAYIGLSEGDSVEDQIKVRHTRSLDPINASALNIGYPPAIQRSIYLSYVRDRVVGRQHHLCGHMFSFTTLLRLSRLLWLSLSYFPSSV